MKQLLILRHAKSSWNQAGLTDHQRPLNARGLLDAPRMGRWIKDRDLIPDIVLCSDAIRARTTLDLVASEWPTPPTLRLSRRLYLAAPDTYLEELAQLDDGYCRAIIVGHNPGLEELCEQLTGSDEQFSTANLALVLLNVKTWSEIDNQTRGSLEGHWRPKELPVDRI